MAIIDTLHEAKFIDEFQKFDKSFSYDGLRLLFQHLDALSDDIGENIEFDPIAIGLEYAEYTLEEFNEDYGTNIKSFDDFNSEKHEDELNAKRIEIIDFFNDRSVLVPANSKEMVLVHHV
jgi:hypothetical protein